MAGDSKIEWTDATWNPIVGCSIVSPGCTNCYAMKDAWRKHHNPKLAHYHGLTKSVNGNAVWTGDVRQAPNHILTAPLHWRQPRMIFVNSMGDLFHESIPDEWIDRVFAVMALAPHHTFQVLTKRAERMREYVANCEVRLTDHLRIYWAPRDPWPLTFDGFKVWPLPNVWLGISAERQQEADERIPHLLSTPSAIRFVSAEPLLGRIYLEKFLQCTGMPDCEVCEAGGRRLDWIIVGGESGPHARPMHPQWARDIRDQCEAAGVPFFFKQWGEWLEWPDSEFSSEEAESLELQNRYAYFQRSSADPYIHMRRVGKKSAGRLLDGKEHNAFPNPRPSSLEASSNGLLRGERAVAETHGDQT